MAESELNRAQLIQELAAIKAGVATLTDRVKSFGSIASVAVLLVAGLAAFRRGRSGTAGVKPSRLQTIRKVASLVSTIWLAFSSYRHDQANK